MGVKVLPAKLASDRAWQVYCLMNPAAQKRIGLKADLDPISRNLKRLIQTPLRLMA